MLWMLNKIDRWNYVNNSWLFTRLIPDLQRRSMDRQSNIQYHSRSKLTTLCLLEWQKTTLNDRRIAYFKKWVCTGIWVGVIGPFLIADTVNANGYLELMKSTVIPEIEQHYDLASVVWHQDEPWPQFGSSVFSWWEIPHRSVVIFHLNGPHSLLILHLVTVPCRV
jgi:hypothetical protein